MMPENKCHCGKARFTKFSEDEEKCIFHCEKKEREWFTENSDVSKDWNEELVKEFWEEVREKMKEMKQLPTYNFNNYIFSPFFLLNEEQSSRYVVASRKKEGAITSNEDVNFWQRNEPFLFDKSVFFSKCEFIDVVDFSNVIFEKYVAFESSTFYQQSLFQLTKFCDLLEFVDCNTNKKGLIRFELALWKKSNFIFNTKKKDRSNSIIFKQVEFSENTKFLNFNLSKTSFLNSNIEKVNFKNCHFSPQKDNEIIEKEVLFDQREVEKNKDATAKDFEKVENLYRQLKKNFDEKKDYQKADDFYVGEMEMMRRKLMASQKKSFWNPFFSSFIFQFVFIITFSLLTESIKNTISEISTAFSVSIAFFLLFSVYIFPVLLISFFFGKWRSNNQSYVSKLIVIHFYKLISNYNYSPFNALFSLIVIIFIFTLFFDWINYYEFLGISIWDSLYYSISNSILFFEAPEITYLLKESRSYNYEKIVEAYEVKSYFLLPYVYLQKILSAGIILLLGLSLRRKFKR